MKPTHRLFSPVKSLLVSILVGLGFAATANAALYEATFTGTVTSGANNGASVSFKFSYDTNTTATSTGRYNFPGSSLFVSIGSTTYEVPSFAINITDGGGSVPDELEIINTATGNFGGVNYVGGSTYILLRDITFNPTGIVGTGLDQVASAASRFGLFEAKAFQFYANNAAIFETGSFTSFAVIPEPSSAALFAAFASLGFVASRRRVR